MEDQQIYKTHLASNSSNSLYYQQMQHQPSNQVLHHSYDSVDMNASESSSSSPHLSQDSRDVTSGAQVEVSRPSQWTNNGSANHIRARNNSNCFEQSLPWNPQNNVGDGYQVSYYPQLDNHAKTTSGALHKLDSFTQVFARQNLRIHARSQGLPQPSSLLDADSTLRQLLSLKAAGEEQTQPSALDRCSQVSQQMHQGLANQPQKYSLQQAQSHFYYEYLQHQSQAPSQSLMQQEHQFRQQVQSNQVLQQHPQETQQMQYYMQQHPRGQQRPLAQEVQPRQFSGQMPQYYPTQPAEIHHNIQQPQQHQMQLQQQSYNANCTAKADHYQQDHSQSMQLIQLGSVPQYVYQNSQTHRHPYKQNLTPQHHLQQEVSPQKHSNMDNQQTVLMDSPVGLPGADQIDNNYNQEALAILTSTTHQQVLAVDNPYMLGSQGLHHSPSTAWPQLVPDGQTPTVSPDNRMSKTCLTCSVCFKEFRSLPALNGHLRSHGGVRTSNGLKQEEGEKPQSSEAENLTPIVIPVSVPVKLAPPEPNAQPSSRAEQLEGCASDDEMPILTRMTFTPPSSPKAVSSCASSETVKTHHPSATKLGKPEDHTKPQERRKYRHRPEPLFIPPPSFNANTSHATLYQSQLRSPRIIGETMLGTQELPTYTPPPMLSPVRQGSGLFSSVITAAHNAHLPLTPLTPTPRVLLCRSNSIDGTGLTITPGPGEHTVDVEPRINIGARFQAEIPDLQCGSSMKKVMHKATLVWKPWPDLEKEESQQRVDVFLSMSSSSVLPGGGTNLEYALHSLFESSGNIMNALEMLLLKDIPKLKSHPLADYHYAGSDCWNNAEKKTFNKGLITCNKDFFHVQKMIKTKTVSQCVEYYYTWKKILHMGRRQRMRLVELNEDDTTSVDDVDDEEELENRKYEEESKKVQKSLDPLHPAVVDNTVAESLGPPVGSFVCEMGNCGATFCSRQALNGHARIHAGTSVHSKMLSAAAAGRQRSGAHTGYCSVKSSPAHSTTSGETDTTSVFPCKICGKVFYKIKSRNAHMKTHRQQEEQQKQKAQKAAMAVHMADTIARTPRRTTLPTDSIMLFDHFSLLKTTEEGFDEDVAQDLQDVLEETEVMRSYLLLDDEDVDLLQDGADL